MFLPCNKIKKSTDRINNQLHRAKVVLLIKPINLESIQLTRPHTYTQSTCNVNHVHMTHDTIKTKYQLKKNKIKYKLNI